MTGKDRSTRLVKAIAHVAALGFCAFWLVATSSAGGQLDPCFTGITTPATVAVTLGPPQATDGSTASGCQGVDGLMSGSSLAFTLSGPGRDTAACFDYETTSIGGVPGVVIAPPPPYGGNVALLTDVSGTFSSPQAPGCTGTWHVALRPTTPGQQRTESFDAAVSGPWVLDRTMTISRAETCGGAFAGTGVLTCEDLFTVTTIAQTGP